LALGEAQAPETLRVPHFGFDMDTPEEVQALRARLVADGIELVDDEDTETSVGFKCLDPDKHVIEVAWET
jgi:hypothetical protein